MVVGSFLRTNQEDKHRLSANASASRYAVLGAITEAFFQAALQFQGNPEMRQPVYPAARAVATKIETYFAGHLGDTGDLTQARVAAVPTAEIIEAMVDAVFWASLRREEGYVPRISLAFLSPDHTAYPLIFDRPLPLDPIALARVAPAVERHGIHLGIWPVEGALCAWGTTRSVPILCCVVEVAGPGLLVIKHYRGENWSKFANVAVLEGDQIKIVDEHASSLPACASETTSMPIFESDAQWAEPVNILEQIAVSMRAHGRGGSLLIVPDGSENWRESIVHPMPYAALHPFRELSNIRRQILAEPSQDPWATELSHIVDTIAGLTAVDGAAVLTSEYALLGFGAKIMRHNRSRQVEQVIVTEPIEGNAAALVHPEHLGGTRHLSAAQFVHDQHDAVAMVASQDGKFTVFGWSPREEMVHAHRVDTLLL